MRYQTTKSIKSLANGGSSVGANKPVSPAAFTPAHWAALLAEGVVVEIKPQAPEVITKPARKTKAGKDA